MKGVLSLKSNYKVEGEGNVLEKFEEGVMMLYERIGNGLLVDEIV